MSRPVADPGAKPLDVGNGVVAASFDSMSAALLSLLTVHPEHGVVELSGMPPFDESRRGDPVATRAYRMLMAGDELACCWLETDAGDRPAMDGPDLDDPLAPAWRGRLGTIPLAATATAPSGAPEVILTWRLAADGGAPAVRVRFRGRLDRPALAEITEINPPQPTGAETILIADGGRLLIGAAALPATATLDAGGGSWSLADGGARLEVPWPGDRSAITITLRFRLGDVMPAGARRASARRAAPPPVPTEPGVDRLAMPTALEPAVDRLVGRALAYVRGCTALAVASDERVLLTDHRLLPLSWTRDAYYQALLLLSSGEAADVERVADHLRWVWRRCERPDGRWVRSHHANGRRKDLAFQADQQLYPLIELADFWRATGELPDGVAWADAVATAWSAALGEVDPTTGLIASAENAADDPAAAPFIAASQILLWYAALRLAELAAGGVLALDAEPLQRGALELRAAFDRFLAGDAGWSYATDGGTGRIEYHDANDLPVALAPLWGFCNPDDAAWLRTMEFALSERNPGFCAGPRGGLGSVHTPGPWALGDVQAWIVASLRGDADGAAQALQRLVDVAFEDGMLPEAYTSAIEPDMRVRHWFAWPGAALGAPWLLQRRGLLDRLRARY